MVLNDSPHSLSSPGHKAPAAEAIKNKRKIAKPKPKGPTMAERIERLSVRLKSGRLLRQEQTKIRVIWAFDDTNEVVATPLVKRLLSGKNIAPREGGLFPDQGQLWGWVDAPTV